MAKDLLAAADRRGRRRPRPDLALLPGQAVLLGRAEPAARPRAPGRRCRGAAGHAGADRRLASSEDGRDPLSGPTRPTTSPSSAASICAIPAATTPGTHGDPQPAADGPGLRSAPGLARRPGSITGPAVHDVETVFRERWLDPTPLSRNPIFWLHDKLTRTDLSPDPLPTRPSRPQPVAGGTHVVQLLRTYPNLRHGRDYPFARGGERSVARGYNKALRRAEHLVYIEDQYLWSTDVASAFVEALRRSPELRVIAVLPRMPDQDSALSTGAAAAGPGGRLGHADRGRWRSGGGLLDREPPQPAGLRPRQGLRDGRHLGHDRIGQLQSSFLDPRLRAVGGGDRRRPTRHSDRCSYARRLRLTLAAEHLDRQVGPAAFPGDTSAIIGDRPRRPRRRRPARRTRRLPRGRRTPSTPTPNRRPDCRPGTTAVSGAVDRRAGCGRCRRTKISPLTRLWAEPMYRAVHDPDGRPRILRQRREF